MSDRRPARAAAIFGQKCPTCLRGTVFTGAFTMNETCPECAVRFEREPGYFLGAMYVSYMLSIPIVIALTAMLSFTLLSAWELHWAAIAAWMLYLFLVPAVFRYSRIMWMHVDRHFNPDPPVRIVRKP